MSEFERKYESAIKRFWNYALVRDEESCWEWLGSMNRYGYGQLSVNGTPMHASRLSLQIELDRELRHEEYACHKCDYKGCVNPAHLFVGSAADNSRDAMEKNLVAHGERQPSSKITAANASSIYVARAIKGESLKSVAGQFGVTTSSVTAIAQRKTWRRATESVAVATHYGLRIGERHGRHKLTREDAIGIYLDRVVNRLPYKQIAEKYKISRMAICDIVKRRTWIEATEHLANQGTNQ
jgi:hypothetical protein